MSNTIMSRFIVLPTHPFNEYRQVGDNNLCWFEGHIYIIEPHREKTVFFAYAKTKTQISFAVTAKLISAFVFASRIVQFLSYLNSNFQASSHHLWLHSPICVGPGRKPRRPVFSGRGSVFLHTRFSFSAFLPVQQSISC